MGGAKSRERQSVVATGTVVEYSAVMALADRLDAVAGRLDEIAQQVSGAVARLEETWHGQAAAAYAARLRDWTTTAKACSARLPDIAQAVRRSATGADDNQVEWRRLLGAGDLPRTATTATPSAAATATTTTATTATTSAAAATTTAAAPSPPPGAGADPTGNTTAADPTNNTPAADPTNNTPAADPTGSTAAGAPGSEPLGGQAGVPVPDAAQAQAEGRFETGSTSDFPPLPADALGLPAAAPAPDVAAVPQIVSGDQLAAYGWRNLDPATVDDLNRTLDRFDITTPERIRHFLSQCAHESGYGTWREEIASGAAYDGRADLGNVQAGDGPHFKGAGYIQLTGRSNYQQFADAMGDPEILTGGAQYVGEKYPWSSAGFWWSNNHMNDLVDAGASVEQVTRRVNGGINGLADRLNAFARTQGVF